MDSPEQLLTRIEVFLSTRRMAETTFGRLAVNDGKFVGRLRAGDNVTVNTIKKATAFIADTLAREESVPHSSEAA